MCFRTEEDAQGQREKLPGDAPAGLRKMRQMAASFPPRVLNRGPGILECQETPKLRPREQTTRLSGLDDHTVYLLATGRDLAESP